MALAKVGILAFKAVAKPITKSFATRCKTNPTFKFACITMARWQNMAQHRLQVSLLATRPTSAMEKRARATVKPLCEKEAVENGSALVAELSMISVGAFFVILDYRWKASGGKSEKREKAELVTSQLPWVLFKALLPAPHDHCVNHCVNHCLTLMPWLLLVRSSRASPLLKRIRSRC